MDLFRRLFNQPATQRDEPSSPQATSAASTMSANTPPELSTEPEAAPSPQPDSDESPSAQETSTLQADKSKTAELSPVSTVELNLEDYGDGVTRPLPQDALMNTAGSDHPLFGQVSDIGRVRTNNEDAAFSFFATGRSAADIPDFGVFVVADGMGGHTNGEKASATAARTVAAHLLQTLYFPMLTGAEREDNSPITELLDTAVQKAHAEVTATVPDGGTTVSAVVLIGDLAYIAHVGDSRVYLVTKSGIEQLTRDHSLVQRLIELDHLTVEEANEHPNKNVLYRALGQNETLEVDTLTRRLPAGSRLLICSDGLWNQVPEVEIQEVIITNTNPQEACSRLVAMANNRGGPDNITAIVLQLPR